MNRLLAILILIFSTLPVHASLNCRGEYLDTKGKGPTGELALLEENSERAIYQADINNWKYRAEWQKTSGALKLLIYFNNVNAPSLYTSTVAPAKDLPVYSFSLLFGYKLGIACEAGT